MKTLKKLSLLIIPVIMIVAVVLSQSAFLYTESAETAYAASGTVSTYYEEVPFSLRLEQKKSIPARLPTYSSNTAGSCGPVAGAIILGYYDVLDPGIIPNFTAGTGSGASTVYAAGGAAVNSLIANFNTTMGNVNGQGVTVNGFKTGFTQYVNALPRTVTFTQLKQNGQFNFDTFSASINNGVPVVLFLSSYIYVNITTSGGKDMIAGKTADIPHIAVAFGEREIAYSKEIRAAYPDPIWYDPGRMRYEIVEIEYRRDYYFTVSFGDGTLGYLMVQRTMNGVDDAYAVSIT